MFKKKKIYLESTSQNNKIKVWLGYYETKQPIIIIWLILVILFFNPWIYILFTS